MVQVVSDSGELPLDQVYDLISDGENLPVHCESGLKVTQYTITFELFNFLSFSCRHTNCYDNGLIFAVIEREKHSVLHMPQAV